MIIKPSFIKATKASITCHVKRPTTCSEGVSNHLEEPPPTMSQIRCLKNCCTFHKLSTNPPPKKKKNVPSSVQKKSQKWDLPAFIYIIATQTEKTTSILQLPTATDDPPSLSVNGFTLVLVIHGKDYITP